MFGQERTGYAYLTDGYNRQTCRVLPKEFRSLSQILLATYIRNVHASSEVWVHSFRKRVHNKNNCDLLIICCELV